MEIDAPYLVYEIKKDGSRLYYWRNTVREGEMNFQYEILKKKGLIS